ncbi:hypothetical protein CFBP2533_11100 [Xanthomonas hortorum pv. pelargonii]|uniref:Tn3 transposase DDE domain-containing protein n=1 Tax=Xanthomonas hortorum pv. pelargonii TaxID=453602 RepID=A0A6V7C9I9_9XANT|nr:hypothetical protein CFBP2533_11100 [Xanthomonas hortorum pv. pelargonii]CAD0312495.1 hypothetical protein CFBP2533_11100 [Xanthomonas hortorum pv. pelargonii]
MVTFAPARRAVLAMVSPRLRYNQLVADLVILHNVEQMTRVLAELREDGAHISAEVLAGLSPYRTSHIKPVR